MNRSYVHLWKLTWWTKCASIINFCWWFLRQSKKFMEKTYWVFNRGNPAQCQLAFKSTSLLYGSVPKQRYGSVFCSIHNFWPSKPYSSVDMSHKTHVPHAISFLISDLVSSNWAKNWCHHLYWANMTVNNLTTILLPFVYLYCWSTFLFTVHL